METIWLIGVFCVISSFGSWLLGRYFYYKKRNQLINALNLQYFNGVSFFTPMQDKALDLLLQGLSSNDMDTGLTLGNSFRNKGEVDRAIKIHQWLISSNQLSVKERAKSFLELAKDYMYAGMLDKAEKLLLELINANEEEEISLKLLMSIYEQGKDWQRAIDIGKRLLIITKEPIEKNLAQFYCELAEKFLINNNYMKAEQALKEALLVNYKCVRASILLGNLEFAKKNYNKAIKNYRNVWHQNANYFSEVINQIARCYDVLESKAEMLRLMNEYLAMQPTLNIALAFADWVKEHGDAGAIHAMSDYLRKLGSLDSISKVIELNLASIKDNHDMYTDLRLFYSLLQRQIESNSHYRCQNCGFACRSLCWHCPSCKQWDTIQPMRSIEIATNAS